MEEFAYAMEHDLPEAVKNELYEEQLSVIREKYQEKRNDYVKVLQKKAKGKKSFAAAYADGGGRGADEKRRNYQPGRV